MDFTFHTGILAASPYLLGRAGGAYAVGRHGRPSEQIARERELRRGGSRKARAHGGVARRRASDALRATPVGSRRRRPDCFFLGLVVARPQDRSCPDRSAAGRDVPDLRSGAAVRRREPGVLPEEFDVSGQAANFVKLSAPRTHSWPELARATDFFLEAQAFEGRALDHAALMDKAREALGAP